MCVFVCVFVFVYTEGGGVLYFMWKKDARNYLVDKWIIQTPIFVQITNYKLQQITKSNYYISTNISVASYADLEIWLYEMEFT